MRRPQIVPQPQGFGSPIAVEMSALAVQSGAVNLVRGFTGADGPPEMLRRAEQAIAEGVDQMPPGHGLPGLLEAIAEHRTRFGQWFYPEREIVVTAGATEAIAACMVATVQPGDQVIVVEPYYDSYRPSIALAGAERVAVSLRVDAEAGRVALDVDAIRDAITPRTRVLMLNSPHNPTGMVLSDAELAAVAELCVEHDLVAVTDEVYEDLLYDGRHVPLGTLPGMAERTLTISSAGKMFNCPSWNVGWVCGPRELLAAVRVARELLSFGGRAAYQPAVAYALQQETGWASDLRDTLRGKRDRLTAGLTELGFDVLPCAAGYFALADIRPLGFTDGVEFCRQLPAMAGVAGVPVQVSTDHPQRWQHLVRFAFCKPDDMLTDALTRLRKL